MEKTIKRSTYFIIIFCVLFFSLLFQELVFRVFAFHSFFGIELIRIILFVATTSAIFTLIFTIFNRLIVKNLVFFSILLLGTYDVIQLGFKNFMSNFMSLNGAGDGLGRIAVFISDFVKYIKLEYLILYLPLIVILILYAIKKDKIKSAKPSVISIVGLIIFVIVTHFLAMVTLSLKLFNNADVAQDYETLYKKPVFQEVALKQFGTIRFLYRDFILLINPSKDGDIDIDIPDNNGDDKPVEKDYVRKINDTEWNSIIANEKDATILQLHNYFKSQNITPKNDMTGVFKDKNFIYIMVEAFDMVAIDQTLTPTLYKIANEGWYFDNHYTPMYSCATGESEFIGLTSIVPNPTVCVPNQYKNNYYPNAIFSLFNKSNYYSTSYHSFTDQFYERTILHPNMGSIKFYNRDDLNVPKQRSGWPSDEDLFRDILPRFVNQDKFFSFVITASTHFPYDTDSTITKKYWDLVKDLPYNAKIKRYMAKAIDLDKGIAYMLNYLSENNKLDNTVIALFGDHHPLKMEYASLNSKSPINRLEDFNIDKTPFIIYNSTIEPKKVETVNSTFDMLPTVANLFDLDYDPRYYAGKDIFSEEQHIVIFSNGSWVSDEGMYFASKGEFKQTSTGSIDPNYATNTGKKVTDYFTIYNETLKKNYFKYRFPNKQ